MLGAIIKDRKSEYYIILNPNNNITLCYIDLRIFFFFGYAWM